MGRLQARNGYDDYRMYIFLHGTWASFECYKIILLTGVAKLNLIISYSWRMQTESLYHRF